MLHYWQDKFILTGYTCTTLPAHCWFAVSKSVALHWKSKKILRLSNRNSVSHRRHSALAIHYTAGWAKRVARSPDWAKYHGPDTRMTIIMQKATSWFFSICYSWWPTLVRFRTSHKPRRGSHHEALLNAIKIPQTQQISTATQSWLRATSNRGSLLNDLSLRSDRSEAASWGWCEDVATTAPWKGRRSIWVNFITTSLRPSPGIMVYVREIIPKLRTIQVSEIL